MTSMKSRCNSRNGRKTISQVFSCWGITLP